MRLSLPAPPGLIAPSWPPTPKCDGTHPLCQVPCPCAVPPKSVPGAPRLNKEGGGEGTNIAGEGQKASGSEGLRTQRVTGSARCYRRGESMGCQ